MQAKLASLSHHHLVFKDNLKQSLQGNEVGHLVLVPCTVAGEASIDEFVLQAKLASVNSVAWHRILVCKDNLEQLVVQGNAVAHIVTCSVAGEVSIGEVSIGEFGSFDIVFKCVKTILNNHFRVMRLDI
ncbi:hypothetical protein J6590_101995 [Homalodisca vitripennis]|nr:hypothetical protein J6590_101995 [Homalodisca vitripennis]